MFIAVQNGLILTECVQSRRADSRLFHSDGPWNRLHCDFDSIVSDWRCNKHQIRCLPESCELSSKLLVRKQPFQRDCVLIHYILETTECSETAHQTSWTPSEQLMHIAVQSHSLERPNNITNKSLAIIQCRIRHAAAAVGHPAVVEAHQTWITTNYKCNKT